MKTKFTWLGIVAIITLVSFTSCMTEPNDGTITYKGRVVTQSGNNPISDITVRITNGSVVRSSMITKTDGLFSLRVFISDLDESFFLELVDKNGNSKKGQLRAFGSGEYDYGDIPFSDVVPVVVTNGITAMDKTSFTCRCTVQSQGNARVTERGLCWATNIPTVNDNKVPSGSGEGEFSCTVNNLNITTTTYYARAYARNEYGVGYGEPVEINSSKLEYFSLPSFKYGGYTYHMHYDLGSMQWEQGNKACDELESYGYSDWYLPNREEMMAVANETGALNQNYLYWTSSHYYRATYGECYYWLIYSSGYWTTENDVVRTYMRHVIPVRKDR